LSEINRAKRLDGLGSMTERSECKNLWAKRIHSCFCCISISNRISQKLPQSCER